MKKAPGQKAWGFVKGAADRGRVYFFAGPPAAGSANVT